MRWFTQSKSQDDESLGYQEILSKFVYPISIYRGESFYDRVQLLDNLYSPELDLLCADSKNLKTIFSDPKEAEKQYKRLWENKVKQMFFKEYREQEDKENTNYHALYQKICKNKYGTLTPEEKKLFLIAREYRMEIPKDESNETKKGNEIPKMGFYAKKSMVDAVSSSLEQLSKKKWRYRSYNLFSDSMSKDDWKAIKTRIIQFPYIMLIENKTETPWGAAAECGNVGMLTVSLSLTNQRYPHREYPEYYSRLKDFLIEASTKASMNGHLSTFILLLEALKEEDINEALVAGLRSVIENNQLETFNYIKDKMTDIDSDLAKNSPLFLALLHGHMGMAQSLLEKQPNAVHFRWFFSTFKNLWFISMFNNWWFWRSFFLKRRSTYFFV